MILYLAASPGREVPLGVAIAILVFLGAVFYVLHRLGAPEWAEILVVVVLLVFAFLIFLGAFHHGPLYEPPTPTHRGFHQ